MRGADNKMLTDGLRLIIIKLMPYYLFTGKHRSRQILCPANIDFSTLWLWAMFAYLHLRHSIQINKIHDILPGLEIALVRSYLRVLQAAGLMKI